MVVIRSEGEKLTGAGDCSPGDVMRLGMRTTARFWWPMALSE
jgi:hypothetical protein